MKNRREFLSTSGRVAGSIVLASGIKLARAMQAAQKLTAVPCSSLSLHSIRLTKYVSPGNSVGVARAALRLGSFN
jgi:hypothetical protein